GSNVAGRVLCCSRERARVNTSRSGPGRTTGEAGWRLAMGEALTIEVRHEQGCAILTVAGEIDISTVTPMRERLFEVAASGAPLVVDLEQVSFIDSVGIAVLVGAAKRAAMHGGTLQVACALPKIRQLVRLT